MASKKKKGVCNCVAQVNKRLLEEGHNTRLVSTIGGICALRTEKADTIDRKKPITVTGSYCPLCGEKYPVGGG